MATLEQIKQTSNFYTITVTINTDNMQYSRSRVTSSPETDKTTLLLVTVTKMIIRGATTTSMKHCK